MLICGISSWQPRFCGIATYYAEQTHAIRELGREFAIVCHEDEGRHADQPNVYGVLDPNDPAWPETVFRLVTRRIRPDVVHVQHEFGLYNRAIAPGRRDMADALLTLLGLFHMAAMPTVITCHTLAGHMSSAEANHYKVMIPLSTITVAHAAYQVAALEENLGVMPRNVTYVEHGANEHSSEEIAALRVEGKRRFGLEGRPVVGMNGWWAPNKNFLPLLRQWGDIHGRLENKDTVLAVMGAPRPGDDLQLDYKARMMEAVEQSAARDTVRVVEAAFSPQEFELSLASFDLALLPYSQASQSGVAAHTGAVGTAMLLRDLEGLGAYARDAGQELIPLTDDNEADMRVAAERIVAIMNDPARLQQMQHAAAMYTHDTISWPRVARRYDAIFSKAIELTASAGVRGVV